MIKKNKNELITPLDVNFLDNRIELSLQRKYPALCSKFTEQLSKITPNNYDGVYYYSCDIQLLNDDIIENVILVQSNNFFHQWGV